ncbi:MAG: hypothetical protein GQ525_10355, partial [Draconibacterium sp.]|nr:hypothetical protein [Draconibacterium sp.]
MKNLFVLFIITGILFSCSSQKLPSLDLQYENSKVFTKGDKLIISTGKIERTFQLTSLGLLTTSIKTLQSKKEWISTRENTDCDWQINDNFPGNLIALTTRSEEHT